MNWKVAVILILGVGVLYLIIARSEPNAQRSTGTPTAAAASEFQSSPGRKRRRSLRPKRRAKTRGHRRTKATRPLGRSRSASSSVPETAVATLPGTIGPRNTTLMTRMIAKEPEIIQILRHSLKAVRLT